MAGWAHMPFTARFMLVSSFSFFCVLAAAAAQAPDHLANTTVLIVRHAEKPEEGASLTPAGFARAQAYTHYFNPFLLDGKQLRINALYAGHDTEGSMRPRLTLEPLSHALHLPLDTDYGTDDPAGLADHLRSTSHGDHVLIAWRHKKIPALVEALGGRPSEIIPGDTWPNDVYDWVLVLRFNAEGRLASEQRLQEPQPLP
jgi:hypothetical protein